MLRVVLALTALALLLTLGGGLYFIQVLRQSQVYVERKAAQLEIEMSRQVNSVIDKRIDIKLQEASSTEGVE